MYRWETLPLEERRVEFQVMTEQNEIAENHATVDNMESPPGQGCRRSSGVRVHAGLSLETGALVPRA